MKISAFHLMPHRDLPDNFEEEYHSVWVDPPFWDLATPEQVSKYYNWTLDELVHAAKSGFDGICVNEHHQNAYGFMPGPNVMGGALALATRGLDVACVQMGATLPTTNPSTVLSFEIVFSVIPNPKILPGFQYILDNLNKITILVKII